MQLELFDYRRDYLFDSENQIAHWYDILKETKDTISYSEHIDPKKGYAVCGMEYEEYVDIKKEKLVGLTYDQIQKHLGVGMSTIRSVDQWLTDAAFEYQQVREARREMKRLEKISEERQRRELLNDFSPPMRKLIVADSHLALVKLLLGV